MDTKQLVLKYYVQKKGVVGIQGILSSKYKINITTDEIKGYIKELNEQGITSYNRTSKDLERADGGLKEIVKSVEQDRKYDYNPDTGHVILYIDNIPHPLLVTTLDEIIASYSRKGKDFSSQKVKYEFQLTDQVRNKIKSIFKIYKDTVPFSIITMLEIPEGRLEEVAQEKAEQLVEARISKIYSDTESRIKEAAFKKFAKAKMGYEMFIEELNVVIENYPSRELIQKQPLIKNNDNLVCFLTDAHLGKNGTQGIIDRFTTITNQLLNKQEKNITILFGDDIAELLVPYGEMHCGQRLGMENITTAELVILCVDVLEEMISKLYNAGKHIEFKTVLGNHSRMTEIKEFDPYRTGGRIIYTFLQKIFKDKVDVEIFNDDYNSFYCGDVKYIVMHGDGLSPAKLNRLALQETMDGKYLCIISGDKHNLAFKEISDKVMRIQAPALSGAGRYDKSLALSALPGYIEMKENEFGLLDINIKRLK